MKRTKADVVKGWLIKAEKDIDTAQHMLAQGEDYTDIVCFHAQQAAEKSLKSYLVWLGVSFPKTHVLEDLLDLISPYDNSLEPWRFDLQMLTPLAVETRYPEFTQPSLSEAQQAVIAAEQVFSQVKGLLPSNCLP